MAIPDYQTLMLPVLQISSKGEIRVSDAIEQLAVEFNLSPEERSQLLPSGRQTTFANRIHWAKTYLGKAGLVKSARRGFFEISDQGREVLGAGPERIDVNFLSRFNGFQDFRSAHADEKKIVDLSNCEAGGMLAPDEVMRNAHAELEKTIADDLLQRIRSCSPAFFERLVIRLLVAMGYGGSVTEVDKALVGGSGDGGVDGVIDQDVLGLDQIYVQAKRYADGNSVGAGAIRDFFGSLDMNKAVKGIFVTTSSFTASATKTAEKLGKRIVLIDGLLLARLMMKHDVGCRVDEVLIVKKIDEDFFE